MPFKKRIRTNYKHPLDYLKNKPKRINWVVVAGNRQLSYYESYDLVFDEYDLKIRNL